MRVSLFLVLFFLFIFFGETLLDFHLNKEGDEQTYADTESEDKPEVNAVDVEPVVGECSHSESDEDETSAEGGVIIRVFFLLCFCQERFDRFYIRVVLDNHTAKFGVVLLFADHYP